MRVFPSRQAARLCLLGSILTLTAAAQSPTQEAAAKADFFETRVRPVFAQNCQQCHNSKLKTAALDLSTGAGLDPARLLRAISYEDNLKMPPAGQAEGRRPFAISPPGSKSARPGPVPNRPPPGPPARAHVHRRTKDLLGLSAGQSRKPRAGPTGLGPR